jgi:predicted nucleic acid-binding protein
MDTPAHHLGIRRLQEIFWANVDRLYHWAAVSYDEPKRGILAIGAPRQLAAVERLWRVLGIVMNDQAVLDKTAEFYAALRASGQLIDEADLLIAAIALQGGSQR